MGLLDLLLVAVGLSMDAFAVSVCKGLNTKMHPVKTGLVAGLYFGGFQALMPTLGYICGGTIRQYIEAVSKYVALFLLCIIEKVNVKKQTEHWVLLLWFRLRLLQVLTLLLSA